MTNPTREQIEAWDTLEGEFRADGFLAPSASTIIEHAHHEMGDWFALARDFNRLAQRLYVEGADLITGRSTHEPLCMGLQLMPRVLSAFQGAVILVERGMSIEAKTLVRVIYETAFWIGYLFEKPDDAAPQLRHDTLKSELGLFKSTLAIHPEMDGAIKAQFEERIVEMTGLRDALPKPPDIKEVARLGGFGLAYIQYRMLSNSAAHASLKSTIGYLGRDEDGGFTGHVIGPDFDGAGEAIYLACYGLMTAIEALRRLTRNSDHDDAFQALMSRFDEMAPYQEQSQPAPA